MVRKKREDKQKTLLTNIIKKKCRLASTADDLRTKLNTSLGRVREQSKIMKCSKSGRPQQRERCIVLTKQWQDSNRTGGSEFDKSLQQVRTSKSSKNFSLSLE